MNQNNSSSIDRNPEISLNTVWLKAAIIGTLWASSEIVLGSFLHNLKLPFASNLLTSIGIIIMIASYKFWKDDGLIWRSGVICALLKTISPSAVIFGPMIAIFMQSALMNTSIFLLRGTNIGYYLGAILAMSWNLVHKLINLVILFGNNGIDIYKNLIFFVNKQLSFPIENELWPIFILLIGYTLLGILSAYLGIGVGNKLIKEPFSTQKFKNNSFKLSLPKKIDYKYSLVFLCADVLLLIINLLIIGFKDFPYWFLIPVLTLIFWTKRYQTIVKRVGNIKFWVGFILITMLSMYVFGYLKSMNTLDALMIGIEMNVRAIVVVFGFGVIGIELYNPKIRHYLSNTYFNQVPMAMELSLETLPMMISNFPTAKYFIKNPLDTIYYMLSSANVRLNEVMTHKDRYFYIISGNIEQGKTSLAEHLVDTLKGVGIDIQGFLAPRILQNGRTVGYNIMDVSSGKMNNFLSTTPNNENVRTIGKYFINQKGLDFGFKLIALACKNQARLVVMDEIGKLELQDKGWSKALNQVLISTDAKLILTVRDTFVSDIIAHFDLTKYGHVITLNTSSVSKDKAEELVLKNVPVNKN
ncbi:MAG TPA: nucleoside-triphosphatase [Saprospiraceae bacterium]|nr:nucleoside-triphosphatase [Saprospiraceae bacterium]